MVKNDRLRPHPGVAVPAGVGLAGQWLGAPRVVFTYPPVPETSAATLGEARGCAERRSQRSWPAPAGAPYFSHDAWRMGTLRGEAPGPRKSAGSPRDIKNPRWPTRTDEKETCRSKPVFSANRQVR